MTFSEISNIVEWKADLTRIGFKAITDGGAEHPLWKIFNCEFPPEMPWSKLPGQVKQQIKLAGNELQKAHVP